MPVSSVCLLLASSLFGVADANCKACNASESRQRLAHAPRRAIDSRCRRAVVAAPRPRAPARARDDRSRNGSRRSRLKKSWTRACACQPASTENPCRGRALRIGRRERRLRRGRGPGRLRRDPGPTAPPRRQTPREGSRGRRGAVTEPPQARATSSTRGTAGPRAASAPLGIIRAPPLSERPRPSRNIHVAAAAAPRPAPTAYPRPPPRRHRDPAASQVRLQEDQQVGEPLLRGELQPALRPRLQQVPQGLLLREELGQVLRDD